MLSISIIYEVLDERVRKLTYQQKAKAIEVYLNNVVISKLAKLINCSACWVVHWISVLDKQMSDQLQNNKHKDDSPTAPSIGVDEI